MDTLQATGAEDKPLLGSTLSADSGAKTKLGFSVELSPSYKVHSLGLASKRKIPEVWGQRPQRNVFLISTRFVRSAHSQLPFFRRTHVSAFNFCTSLFR